MCFLAVMEPAVNYAAAGVGVGWGRAPSKITFPACPLRSSPVTKGLHLSSIDPACLGAGGVAYSMYTHCRRLNVQWAARQFGEVTAGPGRSSAQRGNSLSLFSIKHRPQNFSQTGLWLASVEKC